MSVREAFATALAARGWVRVDTKGGRWIMAHPNHGKMHMILGSSGSVRYGTAHSNSVALTERRRATLLNNVRVIRDVRDATRDEFWPKEIVQKAILNGQLVYDVTNNCPAYPAPNSVRLFVPGKESADGA